MDPWEPPQGELRERLDRIMEWITKFREKAAPTAFMWVEWCALLSLISYAHQQTGLWPLRALQFVLGFLMWSYFIGFFSEEFRWKAKSELLRWWTLVDALLALVTTLGMMFASYWLADMFVKQPL